MRKVPLVNGEYYHVYNRGVEKINIFRDINDLNRFHKCMLEFNREEPIGSLYLKAQQSRSGPTAKNVAPLVEIVAYCLNPNHYHFILKQLVDGGISEFIKRIAGGYTGYINEKYDRTGVLFQGKFKSIHIDSDPYLLHLSAYVNLNDRVHKIPSDDKHLTKSSWGEYMGKPVKIVCGDAKQIILGRFNDPSEYKKVAEESLQGILERRYDDGVDNIEEYLLE